MNKKRNLFQILKICVKLFVVVAATMISFDAY